MSQMNWRLDEDDDEEEGAPESKSKPETPPGAQESAALYKSRTVLIFGPVNEKLAREVSGRLLALNHESAKEPIRVLVNSPGGHVESGDTIHDMIRFIEAPVVMIGTGCVASAAAHIFLAATKKNRVCLPNTRFLLHQPSGGVRGAAVDIGIEAQEIIKMRARINEVIAKETGQPLERVTKDTDRNYWMSPDEAIAYGVVSKIVNSIRDL